MLWAQQPSTMGTGSWTWLAAPEDLVGEGGETIADGPDADQAQGLRLAGLAERALAGPDRRRSASRRPARASLGRRWRSDADREPPPSAGSRAEDAIAARFVRAWQSADLDGLVALLTDDVFVSMPPMPFEYEGRDVAAGFFASIFRAGRRFDLVPTRANGQPAFGAYLRARAVRATGACTS